MAVEEYGQKLLAQLEISTLDQVRLTSLYAITNPFFIHPSIHPSTKLTNTLHQTLHLLRQLHTLQNPPPPFPIPSLTSLLAPPSSYPVTSLSHSDFAALVDTLKANKDESPPLIEISSALPGAGKSLLLAFLTSHYLAQNGAVVIVDCDGRFDGDAVVRNLRPIATRPRPRQAKRTETEEVVRGDEWVSKQLEHLTLFRPRSFASLLATLVSIPRLALTRPLRAILLDGLGAFSWEFRSPSMYPLSEHLLDILPVPTAPINHLSTNSTAVTPPTFEALTTSLRMLARRLLCPVIVTSTRSPAEGTSMAGVQGLCIERERLERFPAGISWSEATTQRERRNGFRLWSARGEWRFSVNGHGVIVEHGYIAETE